MFDGVSVEAEERVGRRALPTLPNAVFNAVKVREALCRRVCTHLPTTPPFFRKRPFAGVHHTAKFLPKYRPDSDLAEFYEIKKLDIVTKDFVEISK